MERNDESEPDTRRAKEYIALSLAKIVNSSLDNEFRLTALETTGAINLKELTENVQSKVHERFDELSQKSKRGRKSASSTQNSNTQCSSSQNQTSTTIISSQNVTSFSQSEMCSFDSSAFDGIHSSTFGSPTPQNLFEPTTSWSDVLKTSELEGDSKFLQKPTYSVDQLGENHKMIVSKSDDSKNILRIDQRSNYLLKEEDLETRVELLCPKKNTERWLDKTMTCKEKMHATPKEINLFNTTPDAKRIVDKTEKLPKILQNGLDVNSKVELLRICCALKDKTIMRSKYNICEQMRKDFPILSISRPTILDKREKDTPTAFKAFVALHDHLDPVKKNSFHDANYLDRVDANITMAEQDPFENGSCHDANKLLEVTTDVITADQDQTHVATVDSTLQLSDYMEKIERFDAKVPAPTRRVSVTDKGVQAAVNTKKAQNKTPLSQLPDFWQKRNDEMNSFLRELKDGKVDRARFVQHLTNAFGELRTFCSATSKSWKHFRPIELYIVHTIRLYEYAFRKKIQETCSLLPLFVHQTLIKFFSAPSRITVSSHAWLQCRQAIRLILDNIVTVDLNILMLDNLQKLQDKFMKTRGHPFIGLPDCPMKKAQQALLMHGLNELDGFRRMLMNRSAYRIERLSTANY